MRSLKILLPSLLALGLMSCATLGERGAAVMQQKKITKEASYAISPDANTALRDVFKEDVARNSGKSGFRIIARGEDSLYARLALMQLAEKSIDLQYYAIADDPTSNLMIEGLILAAERGVRVRLLVDGFTVPGMYDGLMALDGIKNIDIRIFNPVGFADEDIVSKMSGMVSNAPQVNRRMHNKAIISDNQVAMIGGRNLGDEYFDADAALSFKDIDILAAGPITPQISKSFDNYWNDELAYPLEAVSPHGDSLMIKAAREKLEKNWNEKLSSPDWGFSYKRPIAEIIHDPRINLTWANAKFIADDPEKIQPESGEGNSPPLQELVKLASKAQKNFIIVSSYFVPLDGGVKWLGDLERKGVNVQVLTNSLASTDVVAVHSGYEASRKDLLRHGIDLYELKPINEKQAKQRLTARSTPPRAGLHAKIYMIDGRYTLIGSFNLDPRSVNLNTETMLLVDSPEMTQRLQGGFAKAIDPESSYKLALDGEKGSESLVWVSKDDGKWRKDHFEPDAGVFRRVQNFMFSLMPLEEHL